MISIKLTVLKNPLHYFNSLEIIRNFHLSYKIRIHFHFIFVGITYQLLANILAFNAN